MLVPHLSLVPVLQAPLGSEGVEPECPFRVPAGGDGGAYAVRITALRWVETAFFLSP